MNVGKSAALWAAVLFVALQSGCIKSEGIKEAPLPLRLSYRASSNAASTPGDEHHIDLSQIQVGQYWRIAVQIPPQHPDGMGLYLEKFTCEGHVESVNQDEVLLVEATSLPRWNDRICIERSAVRALAQIDVETWRANRISY